jgi:hypothetical protein
MVTLAFTQISASASAKKSTFASHFQKQTLCSAFSKVSPADRGGKGKADMDQDTVAQPARPRLNPYTKALRRERIFSRLRLGASSADVAREEGLSEQRVRKIVADALKRQEVEDPPDHALIQLVRLEGAQVLAAEAVAAGDLTAIAPYLQVLDRIDRYRKTGATKHVYDDEERQRLFAKMNRVVADLEAEARRFAKGAAAKNPPADAETQPKPDSDLTR